ncbi:MAG: XTP/dITP diphosphatase [Lachnospiraceae bacterium]|nr:XTP/dITP diphosphatase [Lachnospiraceae bacterium]
MRRQIIFATGNMGKMREIRDILRNIEADILSMKEAGIETDIVEDGTTFEENAVIKAKAVAELLTEHDGGKYRDAIVLADDSGLEIDYLNKEPGIYSARYMGEHTPYSVKNQNLLKRLAGVPAEKRSARFVCAIAAVMPDGEVITTLGTIEGRIGDRAEGENGFGYDPIFYVPEFGCTTAQLSEEEKNRISHRGRALEAMEAELKKKL